MFEDAQLVLLISSCPWVGIIPLWRDIGGRDPYGKTLVVDGVETFGSREDIIRTFMSLRTKVHVGRLDSF